MADKDSTYAEDHYKALTKESPISHNQIKRAMPDFLGSVHEERIPISYIPKDPDFRTKLDARVSSCSDLERSIPPETKQPAYKQQNFEGERRKTDQELDKKIESLQERYNWFICDLAEMRDILRIEIENQKRTGKVGKDTKSHWEGVKETGNHWKRVSELTSEIYNPKTPLRKEQKFSLLEECVWEMEAELGDDNDKLSEIYEDRCSDFREELLQLGKKRDFLTERERKLRSEYQDPKSDWGKKEKKRFLLRDIARDLEAEAVYWRNIPRPGFWKRLLSDN